MELEDGEVIGYVSVLESGTMQKEADAAADKMKRKASKQVGTADAVVLGAVLAAVAATVAVVGSGVLFGLVMMSWLGRVHLMVCGLRRGATKYSQC